MSNQKRDIDPERIEPIEAEKVRVDFDEDDFELSQELETSSAVIEGRPDNDEWYSICVAKRTDAEGNVRPYTAKMIVKKAGGGDFGKEFYYITDLEIRKELRAKLKTVRITFTRCMRTNVFRVWLVAVTLGNSYYDSLVELYDQNEHLHATQEFNTFTDLPNKKYVTCHNPMRKKVVWGEYGDDDVSGLLLKAIGPDNVIRDRSHQLYQDMTSGEVL